MSAANARPWSEDRLHRWLARRHAPRTLAGSTGHDAAVLARPTGRIAVCVDQTVEGVHFAPDARPRAVGHKAAARALSDLAATAARPRALTLALCAPPERDERWLRAAITGVVATARRFGAELVGGDLSAAPGPVHLSVNALGMIEGRGRPPGRDRARAGDVLLITGPCGGSALGRHLALVPRVEEGCRLHAAGARALMDVSDGLALDLSRMARASGVRFELERVPVHRDARRAARESGRDPRWHALYDGEDHELIAALRPAAARRVLAEASGSGARITAIGRVVSGSGLFLSDAAAHDGHGHRFRPDEGGWLHGS